MNCRALWVVVLFSAPAWGAGKLEFNRDIRPILADACFACHGPDSAARKADLRLDQRDAAVKAGAIVPGNPQKSSLVARIFTSDKTELMPPEKSHKKLKPAEKELLKQWVAEGAEYQAHWSLIAAKKSDPPVVKNGAWVRNPIDRFVLARLEQAGLQPAPEADRRTLIRRLALDLTGLPPTAEDAAEALADSTPQWYENFVAKLMKSPAWGEHRGRYWLDAARYADTHGIHFDNFREMWTYREWVINAFNRNLPFDQFSIEQLAGDLLPGATIDQKIASGFNRCNITTNEGGAIAEEYLVLYARDRTETAAQVWMGLTMGCAVCHDHKFDPFSMRDFYSLAAFFNNTTQNAMDGNIRDTPPIITVPKMEDRPRWEQVSKEIAEYKAKAAERKKAARADFDRWLAQIDPKTLQEKIPNAGLKVHAPFDRDEGKGKVSLVVDGKRRSLNLDSGFAWEKGHTGDKAFSIKPGKTIELKDVGGFDSKKPLSAAAWVKIPNRAQVAAIVSCMGPSPTHRGWDFWYENGKIGMHVISNWPSDGMKVLTKNPINPPNAWHHVAATYDGSGKGAGIKVYVDGVLQPVDILTDTLSTSSQPTDVPLTIGQRAYGERFKNAQFEDVRVYDRALSGGDVQNLAQSLRALGLVKKAANERTPQEINDLYDWWLVAVDSAHRDITAKLSAVTQEEVAIRSRGTIAHIMNEKMESPIAYILARGDYDKRKDKVSAETPKSLPPMAADLPRNRLGLAKWLMAKDHPLTARVTVNRFWQELFGTGLVRTSGDFGITGELPSHPELLDWMALEFQNGGWDVKKFFTLMVTSATYRQAAVTTREKVEKDPSNRLMSRGPRFRMDAEMLRDAALASSGLLVRKLGGPSVKPYQPEGVWEAVAMIGSNTRDYRRDSGENLYRRSMYTFWKRSAPPASMEILNAPNRETCAVRRERTNTPLQALVTLNDPQFVEAARVLAQSALKNGGADDAARLDYVAQRILTRTFTPQEAKIIAASLGDYRAEFRAKPESAKKLLSTGESKPDGTLDAVESAAWTLLINELMNLDEVLNK